MDEITRDAGFAGTPLKPYGTITRSTKVDKLALGQRAGEPITHLRQPDGWDA